MFYFVHTTNAFLTKLVRSRWILASFCFVFGVFNKYAKKRTYPVLLPSRWVNNPTIIVFRFLAKVNPRTEVPMIATLLSGVFAAVLAFIFDLHALVEMMSIGTLLAYTIVAVCVLILRYQPDTIGLVKQPKNPDESLQTPIDGETTSRESLLSGNEVFRSHSTPSDRTAWLAQIATCGSCIVSTGLSAMIIWGSEDILQAKWWAIIIVVLMGLSQIGTVILFLWLPQNKTPLAFKVPFVPVLPQVSMFINIFLILKLSYLTWIRFAVWMVIGEFDIPPALYLYSRTSIKRPPIKQN